MSNVSTCRYWGLTWLYTVSPRLSTHLSTVTNIFRFPFDSRIHKWKNKCVHLNNWMWINCTRYAVRVTVNIELFFWTQTSFRSWVFMSGQLNYSKSGEYTLASLGPLSSRNRWVLCYKPTPKPTQYGRDSTINISLRLIDSINENHIRTYNHCIHYAFTIRTSRINIHDMIVIDSIFENSVTHLGRSADVRVPRISVVDKQASV